MKLGEQLQSEIAKSEDELKFQRNSVSELTGYIKGLKYVFNLIQKNGFEEKVQGKQIPTTPLKKTRTKKSKRGKKPRKLRNEIEFILIESGKPMRISEIIKKLAEKGIAHNNAYVNYLLSQTRSIVRVSKGVYKYQDNHGDDDTGHCVEGKYSSNGANYRFYSKQYHCYCNNGKCENKHL